MTRDEFVQELRKALNHLYEPHCLRRSPLAALFGVANRFDTPSALARILTEAIETFKPAPGEPPRSPAWELYVPLAYRYVEQLRPADVADQLGISERHLRRKEHEALEALADLLWDKFDLGSHPAALPAAHGDQPGAEVQDSPAAAGLTPEAHGELAWLKDAAHQCRTDPQEALPDVLTVAERLAERHRVRLHLAVADELPPLATHPVALRQVLLSLVSVALPRARDGEVRLSVQPERWEVVFRLICSEYPSGPKPPLDDETERLNVAQQLASLSGGQLELRVDARAFDATLVYAALEQLPVLVVDDNADTLQLLQRYAQGTRYRLLCTRDPEEAVRLARECAPQAIVIDLMMPGLDGWAVLAQLQQHPQTERIPVIVCTVLPQKDLATFLGASAFLRKPVTRPAFLEALDRALQPEAAPC